MTSRYLFARRLFSGHLRPARVSVHACWTHSHPPILIHFFSHTYTHKRTLRHAHFAHTPMHAYTLADLFEGNSVSGFGKHMQSTGDTMQSPAACCLYVLAPVISLHSPLLSMTCEDACMYSAVLLLFFFSFVMQFSSCGVLLSHSLLLAF